MQPSLSAQIRVENVSLAPKLAASEKSRGDKSLTSSNYDLLRNISFEVFQSDRVAIVGSSGAGKTSLLRLLNRLSEPTSGAIYLNGQKLTQIPVIQLRQQVALVLQESKLLGMTVQQALEYPLVLRRFTKPTIQSRVSEWVERLRIPTDWLGRTELQLSLGQRQWIAIARALIIQPNVLLLDEPTSALDVGRAEFLIGVLSEISQTSKTTVLMVSHQLEFAQKFCNRLLHLHRGMLVQYQSREQVDWKQLRDSLSQAEAEQADEWE